MRHKFYRLTMVILCVAGILFTGNRVQAQGLTIVVAPESIVSGQHFTLGDIADISGNDIDRITRLRQIRLGNTPSPGRSFVFSQEILGIRLQAARADLTGTAWKIPPQFRITAASQVLNGQLLIAEAEQFLQKQLAGADVVITPISQLGEVLLPPGAITYNMELPYGVKYNSPTTMSIGIQVAGQPFTVAQLRFNINRYEQVAVATRVLAGGELITADSISFERRDIGRMPPGYFTNPDKLLGLAVKRQLAPGTAITDSMVAKPVLITRGKTVTIVAKIGGIEVSVPGTALQSGSESQFIRVKNTSSNKIIIGQVVDETTVQVHLP
ncbi:flagellar basal body P-ring formation chaperone FlgA [Sporomusa sphaeroides]|uniref:Flagellar basal body P-ring biosynthesis protein FlgA n=1 Tax=Sporomusa sphaeroides DSM 2875 TaxID=1337886 RepID=A0ABM9W704_9FIRM|nr:flagellar basal body P-ring formation chaperone FlgA [Sporomusa sphaeroides]OLS55464.1 flagellar basal body P-ring biosynthesis protein FlgA [Sporomusa sphaeroides DSM 2875]CVK19999.1 flagellar basal body P-ring biosynthesis protein FlgA [Sporomusa sphaeroides DSM 2875]